MKSNQKENMSHLFDTKDKVFSRLLSESFKEETLHIHKSIEEHQFLVLLCKEELTPVQYFSHLIDLKFVYKSLEDSIKNSLQKESRLDSIAFKGIERAAALNKDLEASDFFGLTGSPSTEARAYKSHLEDISNAYPLLLIAHAYTRYLGDVSGGLILKKHIIAQWPEAYHFYDFENLLKENQLDTLKAFKTQFKLNIDNLKITSEEYLDLVEEAKQAFLFSGNLFSAIIPTQTTLNKSILYS